jgi:uncharacterized protein (DUF952 family)
VIIRLVHFFMLIWLCFSSFSLYSDEPFVQKETMESRTEIPTYLYKILSLDNWKASENRKMLVLPVEDKPFIHLSTEAQLDKIISKYWSNVPQFVVLKINTAKLEGELIYEINPGGTTKYYHLYKGFIPFDSIVESRIVNL